MLRITKARRWEPLTVPPLEGKKEATMSKTRPPCAPELRQQMVELVRTERSAEELAYDLFVFDTFQPINVGDWIASLDDSHHLTRNVAVMNPPAAQCDDGPEGAPHPAQDGR